MIAKVLVAEDFDSISIGLNHALNELSITNVCHVKYCDEALLKIRKAALENEPFDLVITDLSFLDGNRDEKLTSGEALIEAIRSQYPTQKIIAYSVEDRPMMVRTLFDTHHINAFVHKGRNSIEELKAAIGHITTNATPYISPDLAHVLQDATLSEIDNYDVQLIKQLSLGIPQEKMDIKFQELGIAPNSKSTIEKRISKLKDSFKAKNTIHLVAIAKDLGIA